MDNHGRSQAQRVLVTVGIVALTAALLLLLVYAVDVMLVAFAGVLLAVLLRSLADFLCRHSRLSANVALAVVVGALVLLVAGAGWLLAPDIAEQFGELRRSIPRALAQARRQFESYDWAQPLLEQLPSPQRLLPGRGDIWARVTGVFSTTLGVLTNVVIILFVGLYLAAEPRLYINGLVRLFPPARRDRVHEVMGELGHTLRWWLIGQLIVMIFTGGVVAVALWAIGMPLALALGLLAGLFNFVPYVGPLLATAPALLLALTLGPTMTLYVAGIYAVIQLVESYLLMPLTQQRTASLPPALTLLAQVLLGVLVGPLGIVVATPLLAVTLVLVKTVYLQDVLQEPDREPPD